MTVITQTATFPSTFSDWERGSREGLTSVTIKKQQKPASRLGENAPSLPCVIPHVVQYTISN